MSPTDAVHAVISSGSTRHVLRPGEVLTFGRGAGHGLRIGHSPLDLRVSRYAGRLECLDDGVLIHNTSRVHTLLAETIPGPSFEIRPLTLAGIVPFELLSLVVRGETGSRYAIAIDTRGLVRSGTEGARPHHRPHHTPHRVPSGDDDDREDPDAPPAPSE